MSAPIFRKVHANGQDYTIPMGSAPRNPWRAAARALLWFRNGAFLALLFVWPVVVILKMPDLWYLGLVGWLALVIAKLAFAVQDWWLDRSRRWEQDRLIRLSASRVDLYDTHDHAFTSDFFKSPELIEAAGLWVGARIFNVETGESFRVVGHVGGDLYRIEAVRG